MSIIVFYGRFYLPIPFRHPLRLVTAETVDVPPLADDGIVTDAQIKDVMGKVKASLIKCYETKKPDWEKRKFIIS
jgi:hypothetical protein